ncbi:MAG: FG-GAP-like repeat-containing protein [Bacteroidales bacterium]
MKKFKIIILLLISIITSNNRAIFAQLPAIHSFSRNDSVIVLNEFSDTLAFPFVGGLNSCQFSNIDINLDGMDDILVFDRHGNRLLPFLAISPESPEFRFSPEYSALLPPIEHWVQTADYNFDGKKDIFTYTTGGIKVYRNDSEETLKFKQVTNPYLLSRQGSTLTNILVTYADYPAITDIDQDGDIDILTFGDFGVFVEWHKNLSIENFGKPDSLIFEKVSSCWGQFAESNEGNSLTLDTCAASDQSMQSVFINYNEPKHTGSTMLITDLNLDGLPDLTVGDVDFDKLAYLTNGGTIPNAKFTSQTNNFPNQINPVLLNTFPAAMLADANNDGLKDLLVSPFDPSLTKGENFESTSLYLNMGTASLPNYSLASKSFLQNQMLDFGSGAYPVFFDYNSDGLTDVLVGNYGYYDTCSYTAASGFQCNYTAKIALLLNIGTPQTPVFKLVDRNIAHLDTLEMQSLIPSVADLDGDGDFDLVCGNSKGKLMFCENVALPEQPADFKLIDPAWKSIDVGDFASPQLFDLDQDGLTDLICGKRNGSLNYYKNTGTQINPEFSLQTESLGDVDVTNPQLSNYGYSAPVFYKDNQGETILFVGSEFGDIFVYDQVSNNVNGKYRLLGSIPGIKDGWRSGVAMGALNNDTLTDMLVGNFSGGLGLFFGKPDKLFGFAEQNSSKIASLSIIPNPAINQISIHFNPEFQAKNGRIIIKGIDQKIVRQFSSAEFPKVIDVSGIANGIYLVSVITEKGLANGKFVICR